MRSLYLLIDGLTILGPFIASFSARIQFYRKFWPFLCASFTVGTLFVAWDIFFAHLGVWSFNPRYVEGVFFLHLPLEEILFFLCVPFSCVFTYYCLDRFQVLERVPAVADVTELVIVGSLIVLAVVFHDRIYTSSALVSAAFACLVVQLLGKGRLLGKCFASYAFLLVPFFIVNGVLTGTGLQQPIVCYNDAENLGVRILTIPVEDIFYGFSLIALNIVFFELFAKRLAFKNQEIGKGGLVADWDKNVRAGAGLREESDSKN
jgi:lycopene cyclase domain-containing protein